MAFSISYARESSPCNNFRVSICKLDKNFIRIGGGWRSWQIGNQKSLWLTSIRAHTYQDTPNRTFVTWWTVYCTLLLCEAPLVQYARLNLKENTISMNVTNHLFCVRTSYPMYFKSRQWLHLWVTLMKLTLCIFY